MGIFLSSFVHRQACQGCAGNNRHISIDIVDCIGNGFTEIQLFAEGVRAARIVWIFIREAMDASGTVCHGYVCTGARTVYGPEKRFISKF